MIRGLVATVRVIGVNMFVIVIGVISEPFAHEFRW